MGIPFGIVKQIAEIHEGRFVVYANRFIGEQARLWPLAVVKIDSKPVRRNSPVGCEEVTAFPYARCRTGGTVANPVSDF